LRRGRILDRAMMSTSSADLAGEDLELPLVCCHPPVIEIDQRTHSSGCPLDSCLASMQYEFATDRPSLCEQADRRGQGKYLIYVKGVARRAGTLDEKSSGN
jgi:hypothetical protein